MTNPVRPRGSESGFTLLELLFALLIAVEILIAAAIAFDLHNRMALIQTQITEMQQALRVSQYDIARLVRMAGRGGLPADLRPDAVLPDRSGFAVEVRNNVTDEATDRRIAFGDTDAPLAVEGTDILTLRGCIANPLYQARPETLTLVNEDADVEPESGSLVLDAVSAANIRQTLRPLCEELRAAGPDLLLMVSPEGRTVYGVADVTGHDCPADATVEPTTVTLQLDMETGSMLNPIEPSTGTRIFPPNMSAATACLLEEYRYYVREDFDDPGDDTTPMRPHLARARFQPGTEFAYNSADDLRLDLADGIFDLQVALGFDSDFPAVAATEPGSFDDDLDNLGVDDLIFEAPLGDDARASDDWLFNHPDDDPADAAGGAGTSRWIMHRFPGRLGQPVQLYQVRVTTIARTTRPDGKYRAPDFDTDGGTDLIEDHDYQGSVLMNDFNRGYRRRSLTTLIDLRNL